MKAEDFLRLSMEQILGVDKPAIDKHFKKFRREFNKVPGVIDSLNTEVTDHDGVPLNSKGISRDLEKLKSHFLQSSPELKKPFNWYICSWVLLFTEEIKLQIEYAQFCFSKYQKEKQTKPVNTKKIFFHIHHFSVHVANVCKLFDKLNTSDVKGSIFSQFFNNLDFKTISIKILRNHLEHFEERLDAWSYLHTGKPVLDMNIINDSTKGINVGACLRVLDIEKDIFYILGEKHNLNELLEITTKIEKSIINLEKWANNFLELTRRGAGR